MASGITHMLLMKHLQALLPDGNFKMDLAAGRDFLQAGAVGPDLPYAMFTNNSWFFSNDVKLADNFHYVHTNQVPLKAFQTIKKRQAALSDDERLYLFCFFLGFLSHILADGIIHPFVRDKVGDYAANMAAHRKLEMDLDVLVFHHLTNGSNAGINFNDTNLHEELKNLVEDCYPETGAVLNFFREMIQAVYGENHSSDDILGWIKGLYRMIDIAEGNHHPLYKNMGFLNDYLFDDMTELENKAASILTLSRPIDRTVNFLQQASVHFFHDVLPRFYEIFIPVAQKAHEYIFNDGPALTESDVACIDLDTGRLASNNDLNQIPIYWS